MLDFLRQRTRSWLVYSIFGIIIGVFIAGFNPCAGRNMGGRTIDNVTLAKVGDQVVDARLLSMGRALTVDPPRANAGPQRAMLDYMYRSLRFVYAGADIGISPLNLRSALRSSGVRVDLVAFNPDPSRVQPLKSAKVMDDLIETLLVSDLAERIGLAVSVDEITDRLLAISRFRNRDTKRFSATGYGNFVRYTLGVSKYTYEDFLRRELLRERIIDIIRTLAKAPDAEVDYYTDALTEKVDLEYVEVSPDAVARTVEVLPADAERFAREHAAEVKAAYEKNASRYHQPEKFKVRGIYLKAPLKFLRDRFDTESQRKDFDDQWAKARASASEIRKTLDDALAAPSLGDDGQPRSPGEIFGTVATEKSEHSKSKLSGGLFDKALSKAELSRWPFGKGVGEAVSGLAPGELAGPVEGDSGFWIMRLEAKVPKKEQKLEEVRIEIAREIVARERAAERLDVVGRELVELARKAPGTSLTDLVRRWNEDKQLEPAAALSSSTTGLFARLPEGGVPPRLEMLGRVPRIGTSREIVEVAFGLDDKAPVPDRFFRIEGQDSLYIIRLAARETATGEDRQSVADRIRGQLDQRRARLHYRALVDSLRRDAERSGALEFTADFRQILSEELRALSGRTAPASGPRS